MSNHPRLHALQRHRQQMLLSLHLARVLQHQRLLPPPRLHQRHHHRVQLLPTPVPPAGSRALPVSAAAAVKTAANAQPAHPVSVTSQQARKHHQHQSDPLVRPLQPLLQPHLRAMCVRPGFTYAAPTTRLAAAELAVTARPPGPACFRPRQRSLRRTV